MEKYCKKISMIGFSPMAHSGSQNLKTNPSSSILASESGGEEGGSSFRREKPGGVQIAGLINLSLEGNENLGDRGADAIA
jgi:hypothetical protein